MENGWDQLIQDCGSESKLSFANGGGQNNNTIPEGPFCDQMGITIVDLMDWVMKYSLAVGY